MPQSGDNAEVLQSVPRIKLGRGSAIFVVASWRPPPDEMTQLERAWIDDVGFTAGPTYTHKDSFLAHRFDVRKNSIRRPTESCFSKLKLSGEFNRRLVELCCGAHSTLGKITEESMGCGCVRIDLEMNIERQETRTLVQDALCCEHCLLWMSLPCTGGPAWNKWIYANAPKTREGIVKKIKWFSHSCPKSLRSSAL